MTENQPQMQVTPDSAPPPPDSRNWLIIGLVAAVVLLGVALVWALLRPPATGVPLPTSTPTPQVQPPGSTATAPCNWAAFAADVTVADDSVMQPGQQFTKTWRLQNIGSCAWDANYAVVFAGGASLGGPAQQSIGATVAPGQTVDISINLTAPQATGSYTAHYKLRSGDGVIFGIGANANSPFWVSVVVNQKVTTEISGVDQICDFAWVSGAGNMTCPQDSLTNGSVMRQDNPGVEISTTENEPAIVVMPNDGAGGYVTGTTNFFTVQPGDRVRTVVGCMANEINCNLTFEIGYKTEGGAYGSLAVSGQAYDGSLDRIDLDLTGLAGQSVQLVFTARSNTGTSRDNSGFWLNPRLVRYQ
jgi:Ig-like domain-containing protein